MDRKQKVIKIKLLYWQVSALNIVYADLVFDYKPRNAHEQLLHEHIVELHFIFREMQFKEKEKYSFLMSPCQALAFFQLWQNKPLTYHALTNQTILAMLEAADKGAHQKRISNV